MGVIAIADGYVTELASQGRDRMRSEGFIRVQIGTLIIATSVIQLANGFYGTFISLRVGIESFDAIMEIGRAHV